MQKRRWESGRSDKQDRRRNMPDTHMRTRKLKNIGATGKKSTNVSIWRKKWLWNTGLTRVDPRGNIQVHASGSTGKYTGSRAWSHVEKAIAVNKNTMLCRIKVDCALNTHRNPLPRLLTRKCWFLLMISWPAWYNPEKCESSADSYNIFSWKQREWSTQHWLCLR